jgi:hypothetical protein
MRLIAMMRLYGKMIKDSKYCFVSLSANCRTMLLHHSVILLLSIAVALYKLAL